MLRGEAGIYYEDLYPLVCFLPRYATHPPTVQTAADMLPLWEASLAGEDPQAVRRPAGVEPLRTVSSPGADGEKEGHENGSGHGNGRAGQNGGGSGPWPRGKRRKDTFDPELVLPSVVADRPLLPARNPPKTTLYDYLPLLLLFKPFVSLVKRVFAKPPSSDGRTSMGRRKQPDVVESNVPLEITLFLSSYLAFLLRAGLLQPAIATALTNNIAALQDTMANLDRVRSTPIPYAYQAHLRLTIWWVADHHT